MADVTPGGRPLSGKVAIVTGSGRNIGRSIAHALAADGAKIVVNGRSDQAAADAVVAEIKAAGGEAIAVLADVSNPDDIARLVERATQAFGGVDIAVANAAIRRGSAFLDVSFAEWREVLSIALDGAFLLAQKVVPSMAARGGGTFIGISGVSHHIGFKGRIHVNAAKSGLEGLIRGLAVEVASMGITANAVCPGVIVTARVDGLVIDRNKPPIPVPLGRLGDVEDIAAAVRFLAGPGGRYVTGQTLHVNGGAFFGH